jgi:hypothetical protein
MFGQVNELLQVQFSSPLKNVFYCHCTMEDTSAWTSGRPRLLLARLLLESVKKG